MAVNTDTTFIIDMTEYRIKNINDHILIEGENGLLIVDTGSPLSFHESGQIKLCGQNITVPRSLPEAGPEYLSGQLGVHVSGLVGMDFIVKHPMSVDVNAGLLTFDSTSEGYVWIPSSSVMGCVRMNMEIDGRPASIILDTGAPTSYMSKKFSAGKTSVGSADDFSPYCGVFTTPIYEYSASVGGREFTVRAGKLPALMGLVVGLVADGVFGMDFLKHFKVLISREGIWISE